MDIQLADHCLVRCDLMFEVSCSDVDHMDFRMILRRKVEELKTHFGWSEASAYATGHVGGRRELDDRREPERRYSVCLRLPKGWQTQTTREEVAREFIALMKVYRRAR